MALILQTFTNPSLRRAQYELSGSGQALGLGLFVSDSPNLSISNMHQTEFKIHSYGYSELAQLYRPNVKPQNAWNTLKNWIDNNSELTEALKKTGYGKCSKRTFTPYQVLLIVKYLGSP